MILARQPFEPGPDRHHALRLTYVWPTASRKERAPFEKLKEAYVKARYSKHYRVTAEEFAWLSQRIARLEQDAAAETAKG